MAVVQGAQGVYAVRDVSVGTDVLLVPAAAGERVRLQLSQLSRTVADGGLDLHFGVAAEGNYVWSVGSAPPANVGQGFTAPSSVVIEGAPGKSLYASAGGTGKLNGMVVATKRAI